MDEEMTRSHVRFDAMSAGRAQPFTIAKSGQASVSVVTCQTLALDETQVSTPTPNLCLVPLKSERARPTRYVRELASQTT
jgi:hypothetical protein